MNEVKHILQIELSYDMDIMHKDDYDGHRWMQDTVLRGGLHLQSDEIGDIVGSVKVLDKRADGWVSVDDRLPEDMMRMILVWDSGVNQPRLLLGAHLVVTGATHWQPLPTPPEA